MPKSPAKSRASGKRKATASRKATKSKRPRSARSASRSSTPRVSAAPPPVPVDPPSAKEQELFMETLIDNGQAARPGEGKLRGVTHSIVEDDTGKLKVVRRRFSIS